MKNKEKKQHSSVTLKMLEEYQSEKKEFHTTWGDKHRIDRLVSVDLRVKFMKAEQLFKKSVAEKNDIQTQKMIQMMRRAYVVLMDELMSLGYKPLEPHIRCFDWDGVIWYVTDLDYEIPRAMQRYKHEGKANFISIQELLRCVPKELMDMRLELAMMFEGSKFVRIEKK